MPSRVDSRVASLLLLLWSQAAVANAGNIVSEREVIEEASGTLNLTDPATGEQLKFKTSNNQVLNGMPLFEVEPFSRGDDVVISDTVMHSGRDLKGTRARIALWDETNAVWAIKLGETGEVVGVKAGKLRKVRTISLDDLDFEGWLEIPSDSIHEIDLPAGVDVQVDLSTGAKKVRKAGVSGERGHLTTTTPAVTRKAEDSTGISAGDLGGVSADPSASPGLSAGHSGLSKEL